MKKFFLKLANKYFGEKIIYGHLSSASMDRLWERAELNRKTKGETNYTDLARFLFEHPL